VLHPDTGRGEHTLNELFQPASFINPLIGFRPDTEFLDVIKIDRGGLTSGGGLISQ